MKRSSRRMMEWMITATVVAVGLYFFPLFRVVPLQSAQQNRMIAAFEPEAFVEKLWNEQLTKPDLPAVDAARLVQLLREQPAAAADLGHRLGLSRTTCYCIRGTGQIVSVTSDAVAIAIESDSSQVSFVIETGPVFGNAIRDGCGLLNVSTFPNSQDFNAISTALNRLVEERVLPELRAKAVVGAKLRFVGAAEVNDPGSALPLRLVPIRIEWL